MSKLEKDVHALWKHPLLSGVARDRAQAILEDCGCGARNYENGEVIFCPDTKEKAIGFMLRGKAVVETPDSGRNTLLRFLDEGELFGVSSLFSEDPFISVIVAHSPCRVFFVSEEAVRRLLESDTTFLYRYLGFLSGRVRYLNRKIGYLTAGSAERRLALYLCSLEKEEILLDSSISSLSDLLDLGRASLYRSFDRLEADGLIKKTGRRILVLQREAMLHAYQ